MVDFTLTAGEKRTLLEVARETLRAKLFRVPPSYPDSNPNLNKKCGAFVTLHKRGKLRGCIGYVEPIKSLIETVKEVAESSAFRDPRFSSVRIDEFPELEIEISALSPLRPLKRLEDIQIGRHGILMRRGHYSGLLLPQVATEYGWDRRTFLSQTCCKAGLPGDCWKEFLSQTIPGQKKAKLEIDIFTAIIFNDSEFG